MSVLAMGSVSVIDINDGVGISSSVVEYCVSDSGTTPPGNPLTDGSGNPIISNNGYVLTDGSWSATLPTVPEGYYLWTRTRLVMSDGTFDMIYTVSRAGEDGATGATGVSVVNVIPEYRLSDSSSSMTGSGTGYTWSTTKPKVASGQYIWERQRNQLSDGSTVYSDAVCDITMSGLVFDVDENKKVITQKVWSTDITTSLSQYDSSTVQSIRDDVTELNTDLTGITTRVGTVETNLETKADGSTVTTLQNDYSAFKQTMSGFKTTVESTYAQLSDIDGLKVSGENLYVIKDSVTGYLHATSGAISAQSSTYKEYTSAYIPVSPGKTYIIQSWATPTTTGGSWLAYQFFTSESTDGKIGSRTAKYGSDSGSGVETTAEGMERLTYKVVAPDTAQYLRVSSRLFEDGYVMVEQATMASEYAISYKDVEDYADTKISAVRTIAEQNADKFSWIVQDGSTQSNVQYTANALTAMADQIDLTGKVSFSSFDTDTQNAITSEIELIIGTQTSSTSAWTGTSTKLREISVGTRISYKLPYASTSSAVTLNLTLNTELTTGAKEVYYLNTTRLSNQYAVNSIIQLIYDGSAWRVLNPYSDANTYDRTRYQQAIKAGTPAIVAGNIIVAGANNAGTYTHLKLGNAFDTSYPILYAESAISAGSTGTNNYLIYPVNITNTQSGTHTAYRAVYIKGTLSGTTFTPVSTTPLTQTVPTTDDGYYYILLGTTYSTTGMYLLGQHEIFRYYNDGFKTVSQIAAEAAVAAENAQSAADAADNTANTAKNTANTALNGLKAFTGTSSTATGTAAKVVSCSDSTFALTNGVTITVTFSTANTAEAPTLNVNSLGAKAIYFDNAVASANNRFHWQAGSVITFQYNGTYWVVLNYENLEYFTSSTAAGTAAKVNASVTGTFVLCKGTTINVYFSTANTAAAPTLNIGETGAYAVYYKNAVTSSSNTFTWDAGATLTFTYNGSYWYVNDGGSLLVKNYAKTAVDWVSTNGSTVVTAAGIMKTWTGDATLGTTTIDGGYIKTNTIESQHLATDAIMSNNFQAISGSVFSSAGSYLDLSNGNFYTPNFGVSAAAGSQGAYINGDVVATSGTIGSNATNYWEIGNVYDYNATESAAIIGHGTSYIQSGNWQLSNNRLNTQYYSTTAVSSGNLKYYKDTGTNTFYDVGVQIPTDFTTTAPSNVAGRFAKSFFYGRKYTGDNAPSLDGNWTYFYLIDTSGNMYLAGDVYEGGTKLSDKYALKTDVGSTYLPTAGGTVTGNLTVNGETNLKGKVTTTLQIRTNLGSTSAATFTGAASAIVAPGVTGTLGVGNGGTGKSSWTANGILYASASNALAQMAVGTSGQVLTSKGNAAPAWTNQSALSVGSATKATQDSDGNAINTTYRKLTNNTFDSIDVTDLSTGNLTVTGAATFTNGLSGDLTGNATTATTATQVSYNLKIQLNSGTTEGTNQFTYNGSAAKNINITKSSVGLGNVENTALSTWAGSANLTTAKVGTLAAAAVKGVDTSISAASTSTNLPTSAAVASFVEEKGYVTSSGVTSITLTAGDGISLNASTAITSTGTRTITNAGVRAISESSSNGKITVNTNGTSADVAVHGLGSWAYKSSGSGSDVGLENVINVKQVTGIGQGDNGKIRVWKGTGANDYEDIEVAITAYDQSVVSKADALDMNTDAGSTTLPVYFPGSGSDAGKPVAITSIPWSLISNAPSTYAPSSHTHGNISNDGKISATATISSGDRLAIIDTDMTAGNKLTGSSITFGSSTTTFLSNSGAWLTPTNTTYTFADGSAGNFTVTPSGGSAQTVSIGTPAKAGALNLSTAIGSATQPVYFGSDGVPVAANKIPKLNNASSDSAFYAPTTVGTSGQVLTSSGSGAPSWVNQSTLSVGTATTASRVSGTAGITNADRHVWFSDSATETIRNYDDDFKYNPNTNTLTVANLAGNAATATKATQDGSGNTITSTYVTLATAQTISGAKTFSAATSFTNTTASTSKTTGAVKVSGGVGVAGRVSVNEVSVGDGVVLQFNTSTNSLDFVFN